MNLRMFRVSSRLPQSSSSPPYVVVNDESRPGIQRFYTEDPWSKRIELVDAERPRASS